MTYYILPTVNPFLDLNNINVKFFNDTKSDVSINISKSLHSYLNDIKKHIDNCINEWDIFKKYTNNYEYIHTLIPNTKFSVCKLKPLSRSFYKIYTMFF